MRKTEELLTEFYQQFEEGSVGSYDQAYLSAFMVGIMALTEIRDELHVIRAVLENNE